MSHETLAAKRARLADLRAQTARLEAELDGAVDAGLDGAAQERVDWAGQGYYLTYYATSGFFLGIVGALASLMFNIIGATLAGKDPLQLIRVYLTRPSTIRWHSPWGACSTSPRGCCSGSSSR
jgi:hypothetical protein